MASPDTEVSYHYDKDTLLSEHDLLLARIQMNAKPNIMGARRSVRLQVGKISEISKLQSIKICDLSPNTENKNTFLYVWLISEVAVAETIRFIVEDEYSNFCRVSIPGNVDTSGLVIGIPIVFCHPLYEMASDGKYSIIFHNISDIFLLTRSPIREPQIELGKKQPINRDCSSKRIENTANASLEQAGASPTGLTSKRSKKSTKQLKQERSQLLPQAPKEEGLSFREIGGILYKEGRYSQAMVQYTCAIQANGEDAVFYSNRALCYSKLLQYEDALSDIQKANSLDPDCFKYQYLIASTWSRLGHHRLSLDLLRKINPKDSIDCESVDRLIEKEKVFVEHMNGKFDFNKVREEYLASGCQPIEIGDFIGPVQIQDITINGKKGLITTRNVLKGENLFVVKAARTMDLGIGKCPCANCRLVAYDVISRETSLHHRIIEDAAISKHTTVKLITLCDTSIRNVNINLFSGSGYEFAKNFDTTKYPLSKLQSLIQPKVSMEMDQLYIQHHTAHISIPEPFIPKFTGIWLLPNLINHSCIPNAVNLHIGNICIVRAITDILEGEEVTTCQIPLTLFSCVAQRNCKNVCKLCSFEARPAVKHINSQFFSVLNTLDKYDESYCMQIPINTIFEKKCEKISREKWLGQLSAVFRLISKIKSLQTYEIFSILFQVAVLKMIKLSVNTSDTLELCLKAEPYFSQLEPESFTSFWNIFVGLVRANNKLKDGRFKHVEEKYKEVMNLFS